MKRGGPLPTKRAKPRRAEGRIQHQRMRPKAGAKPTAEEREHMANIAQMPCLVSLIDVIPECRCAGRVTVHHVTAPIGGGRLTRSHKLVVPLCEAHHQHDHGKYSVERLGHHGFYLVYGIDLLASATRLWETRNG